MEEWNIRTLTCQMRGKFLKFTIIKRMQRSFHIEEGTKVSDSTSFPGSVSKVRGIEMIALRQKRYSSRFTC